MPAVRLCCSDLAHGVMEGHAENLDVEVYGVAGEISFRPAPVAVFDDETGIGGQDKIVRLACDKLESALLQQWKQRSQSGGAYLFARPALGLGTIMGRWVDHSLFSNEVE